MLGLKLRDEFLGTHMPGTAIALRTSDNQGAAQKSADQILKITYPTGDIQTALKAISDKRSRCPIVLMGDRGRGKSHIMAVMHHAINSPDVINGWLTGWNTKLNQKDLQGLFITKGFMAISEPVHNHEYPLLWNLLFDRHPKGDYYRGQFESMENHHVPPRSLLEKMFEEQPVCLILDEFQTWFTGLPTKDKKAGLNPQLLAFNFVQNLSEIAKERSDILIFVISVLNNQNEAFQQVHRQGPVLIDFRGPSAKEDRQKLMLHRLFENRENISTSEINAIAGAYANERFRILHADKSDAESGRIQSEVFECWPFSPELILLLEDHILMSQAAQNARDMIRILAQVYKTRGEDTPIITPADFFVDGETEEVQSLIDSIAQQVGQEKLREIAQRNLGAVYDTGIKVPNARELISAIWMRSMSPGKNQGGTPAILHLDITRQYAIDDNAFQAELTNLIENSINIHGDEVPGSPLWFGLKENPRSKVRACAKNDKLWHSGAVPSAGQTVYPSKDFEHIKNTLRHILVQEINEPLSKVIVLGENWKNDPWAIADEAEKPSRWDRPVLIVIPDQLQTGGNLNTSLGNWLAKHVPNRRNTVRFLLLSVDEQGLYSDIELIYISRCSFLSSREGWGIDPVYRGLHHDFDRPLRQILKSRFNRFAVLKKWDFQSPQQCSFDIEKITEQGDKIPGAVEKKIFSDLFDQTDFRTFVLQRAKDSDFVGTLMDELMEPPPPNVGDALPFLGETRIFEIIIDIAAEGDIVLNVGGNWIGRRSEDSTDEDAKRYIRSRAFRTGQEMRQIQLGLPGSVGGKAVSVPIKTVEQSTSAANSKIIPKSPNYPQGTPADGAEAVAEVSQTSENGVPDLPGLPNRPLIITQNRKSDEPANGINLSGCFEKWGVSSDKSLDSARIELTGLTVQQVKQILQRIPSTFKASLEISFQDGGES
ncbi:MAG: hypothetical protein HQK65_20550 [Desulfamplus sp.]|nr:hypothetical protein [Desulfamplus sp.]